MIRTTLRLSTEEHEIIKDAAELAGKSMNSYIKDIAMDLVVLKVDYEQIDKHTKIISSLKNELSVIARTAAQTGEIYNKDIVNTIKIMEEVLEEEKKFLRQMSKDRKSKGIQIKREIRKELDKRLGV